MSWPNITLPTAILGTEMHFLGMDYENALFNGDGAFRIETGRCDLARWSLLPPGEEARELLQMIAVACGGVQFLPGLSSGNRKFFLLSYGPSM